ncbi:MAG: hypothetical protein A2021_01890 [Elusimicrobia bacterium GWF2_52_66]|nr:MAG: hypothetical protein A2X33_09330 [Elusimicrobia bacterium GWA2_51_34]OGR88352.1 MAG: hypothetical protein A2021_01890 [Elusimicrobia bacterium GWF2_52_66]HAF94619.1 hypothetical protein [Elusimicrobiota bacterium]HCE98047.1 hypothetical protein [Elusimicrobiota bacterium]
MYAAQKKNLSELPGTLPVPEIIRPGKARDFGANHTLVRTITFKNTRLNALHSMIIYYPVFQINGSAGF